MVFVVTLVGEVGQSVEQQVQSRTPSLQAMSTDILRKAARGMSRLQDVAGSQTAAPCAPGRVSTCSNCVASLRAGNQAQLVAHSDSLPTPVANELLPAGARERAEADGGRLPPLATASLSTANE